VRHSQQAEVAHQDAKAGLVVIKDSKGGNGALKRLQELSEIHGVRFIRQDATWTSSTTGDCSCCFKSASGTI
jgi:hypothetical protein